MARRIAIVFQRPVMLRRSAAANVAYGLPRRAGARAPQADCRAPRAGRACSRRASGRRGGSPAASNSDWRLPARSRASRRCCFSTSRRRVSIRRRPRPWRTWCGRSRRPACKIVMATQNLGQARRLAGEVVFMLRGTRARACAGRAILRRAADARSGSIPARRSRRLINGGDRWLSRRCCSQWCRYARTWHLRVRAGQARALPRPTNRSSSPPPPRRRTPDCSVTSYRSSRPRPAST